MTTTPTNGAAPGTEPVGEPVAAEPIDLNAVRAQRNPAAAAAPPHRSAAEVERYPYVGKDGFGRPVCACGKDGTAYAHGPGNKSGPRWSYSCADVLAIQESIRQHTVAAHPTSTLRTRAAGLVAWLRRLLEQTAQRLEVDTDDAQQ